MTPLWFFFFQRPDAVFTDATVAAPSRARACDLLEVVMRTVDPKNSVALRPHPTKDHLWTGEDVALLCGGQADVPEGVLEATDRETGRRALYLGQRADGELLFRRTDARR